MKRKPATEIFNKAVTVRIPGHHVPRIDDLVPFDQVVVAVPEPQTVAAHAELQILGAHLVAADRAVVNLLQVNTEQAIVGEQLAEVANPGSGQGLDRAGRNGIGADTFRAKAECGMGRGYYDESGDWHGVFVMGFQDSHSKPQYQIGYGYKTYWPLFDEIKFGLGYTAFLGFRSDYNHYLPFPIVLPIFSFEYKKIALDTTYVPGGDGFGNVLFTWAKHSF